MYRSLLLGSVVAALATSAFAQDIAVQKEDIKAGKKQYSPYLHQSYPNRVFWGDTHLHTSLFHRCRYGGQHARAGRGLALRQG